jgi:lysine 6-dehydrogenase
LELTQLALEKNVPAILDCVVVPGMDNIILAYYNEEMEIFRFECLVGSLPQIKSKIENQEFRGKPV